MADNNKMQMVVVNNLSHNNKYRPAAGNSNVSKLQFISFFSSNHCSAWSTCSDAAGAADMLLDR